MTTYDFEDGRGPVPAHQHSNGGGWVADSAQVAASAFVGPDVRVYGTAKVYGTAEVYINARIYDHARVYGNARIFDNAMVYGTARVFDGANVYGNAVVYDGAEVYDDAVVYGNAKVCGNAKVLGNAVIGMRLDGFDAAIKENTMSDDLVGWLRQEAADWEVLDNVKASTKLRCAADEIERLRAERDAGIEALRDQLTARWEAEEKIKSLRAALEGLLEGVHGDGYVVPAGAVATQRARAALENT